MIISESRLIPVAQGKIFCETYFTANAKDNAPLLVLHGGPGLTHDYLLPLKEITRQRPVIFYDQLGCGKSTVNEQCNINWNLDYYLSELIEIIDHLRLKNFNLFGHSWGGALAASYATRHSNNLNRLILASPLLGAKSWEKDTLALAYKISPAVHDALVNNEKAETLAAPAYKHALDLFFKAHFCRTTPWPAPLTQSMNQYNRNILAAMWGPYETTIAGNLRTLDLMPSLSKISVLTLATCGLYDIATPETMLKAINEMPNTSLEIFQKSAHFPHLEEQEEYIKVIENFLKI